MDFILRLKNWQLFLIILLLPWILAIGLIMMFDFKSYSNDVTIGIFTIIYYTIFMIWNYRVIKTFNKKELILKPRQLKRLDWLLIILCIYGVYLIIPIEMRMNDNLLMKILSPIRFRGLSVRGLYSKNRYLDLFRKEGFVKQLPILLYRNSEV